MAALALVSSDSATGIATTIDTLMTAFANLTTAHGELGRERDRKVAEKIDQFCASVKTTVNPADAVTKLAELEALQKSFSDQDAALNTWGTAVNERLSRLGKDHPVEVQAALSAKVDALREIEAKEANDLVAAKKNVQFIEAFQKEIVPPPPALPAPAPPVAPAVAVKKSRGPEEAV